MIIDFGRITEEAGPKLEFGDLLEFQCVPETTVPQLSQAETNIHILTISYSLYVMHNLSTAWWNVRDFLLE